MNRHYLREQDLGDDAEGLVSDDIERAATDCAAPTQALGAPERMPNAIRILLLILLIPYLIGLWFLFATIWNALKSLALFVYYVAGLFFVTPL